MIFSSGDFDGDGDGTGAEIVCDGVEGVAGVAAGFPPATLKPDAVGASIRPPTLNETSR